MQEIEGSSPSQPTMVYPRYCPLCGSHEVEWGEGDVDYAQALKEAQEQLDLAGASASNPASKAE